jgi:hypothetical protein
MSAKRLLRRRALAVLAQREVPAAGRRFDPSGELERRGWQVREARGEGDSIGGEGERSDLDLRFGDGEVIYRAGSQLEMRFLLAHAVGHLLLAAGAPVCRYGIATDTEVDASMLGAFLLLPTRALEPAMFRAATKADVWGELGGIVDTVALELGAPPWAVAERASEEGLFSSIADVPIS